MDWIKEEHYISHASPTVSYYIYFGPDGKYHLNREKRQARFLVPCFIGIFDTLVSAQGAADADMVTPSTADHTHG